MQTFTSKGSSQGGILGRRTDTAQEQSRTSTPEIVRINPAPTGMNNFGINADQQMQIDSERIQIKQNGEMVFSAAQEKIVSRLTMEIPHYTRTMDVVLFLTTVEDKCVARGVSELMPIVAGRLLEGPALTWYNRELKSKAKLSWQEFQKCFIKRFSDGKSKDLLLEKLKCKKQFSTQNFVKPAEFLLCVWMKRIW